LFSLKLIVYILIRFEVIMGGYIFFRSYGGLCDSIYTLQFLVDYAKQQDRSIIVDLIVYAASDVEKLLDFSNYPVKVICKKNVIKEIKYTDVEPKCFKSDIFKIATYKSPGLHVINGEPAMFDLNKTYPDSTLLIYYRNHAGSGYPKYLKFTKFLLDEYYKKLSLLSSRFYAVHLRATDHPDQNFEKNLSDIRNFVKNKDNVYLASDNVAYIESLSEEFPQIIKSFAYNKKYNIRRALHYDYGHSDPDLLKYAILDILICASSEEFLPSVGGFSAFIKYLHTNKHVLKNLLKQ
jgi:hypothetical protein